MTMPTKVICPILLEDFRKVVTKRSAGAETNFFTSEMIKNCMRKVEIVGLHQVVHVDDELSIKAYYAGHVLGAAMFKISVGDESVLYTGDFNMTPDRHLGAAWADRCKPTVLISESTYATTIRDSKRSRERDFLKKIHRCVENGGKVLIPVFALGRAQELCILLEQYWDRMKLNVPIYFTAGLAEKATNYYKLFVNWTNEKIKSSFVERNLFDFKYIKAFQKEVHMNQSGPQVCFATPGMLHAGMSLEIFQNWCTDEKNCIIMPGYCVAGTVGHRLLHGERHFKFNGVNVTSRIKVEYMSFSAHADAKGIMQIIKMTEPKNVMFVHGEAAKMEFLAKKVQKDMGLPCFTPANGETVNISCPPQIKVKIESDLARKIMKRSLNRASFHAALVNDGNELELLHPDVAMKKLKVKQHHFQMNSSVKLPEGNSTPEQIIVSLRLLIKTYLPPLMEKWVPVGNMMNSIELASPDMSQTISIVAEKLKTFDTIGNQKVERLLKVTWPLSVDDEIGILLSRLSKEFALVVPR